MIIANNYQAASAAAKQARESGLNTLLLTSFLQGEAREVGQMMAALARQIQATGEPVKRPACIIAGGETTVTVRGDGKGGRNQELALGEPVRVGRAIPGDVGRFGDGWRRRSHGCRRSGCHWRKPGSGAQPGAGTAEIPGEK